MKKNALGFIALAMAFMGTVAMAATQDPQGAIRSIDRCNEYGVVLQPGTIETSLTVGDKAYFRIRLENHNSQAIWKSWNQSPYTNRSNPWYFWDDISGLQTDPVTAGIRVGVFVSGRFTLADVIDVIEDIRTIDLSDGGGPWFTDLLCSYTVQPGDLALPVTLANSNRDEATASDTTAYFVGKGSTLLTALSTVQLRSLVHDEDGNWDDITGTMACSFKFGDYWSDGVQGQLATSAQSFAKTSPGRDYTLFNAGIFIQSIDFDKNTETVDEATFGTNEVWRAVHERSTSTKEFVPSLFIPGEVPEDYYGSVYLWSADANSVMLPDATIPVNGTMVQKLNFDGSAASLQFRLRGVTQNTKTEIFLSSTLTNVVSGSGRTITNFVSRTVACIAPLAPGVNVLANGAPTMQLNATPDYTNVTPFKVELTQVWTNNEPVTVKFRYYLTNSTEAVSAADLSKMALIALSDDQQFGYDSILPDSVTIPAGDTVSTELDTNVRALYTLGALTGSNKGDKIVIEPYFEDPDMAAFFSAKKPLTLTIYGMKPNIQSVNGFNPDDLASNETASALSVRGGVTSEFEVRVSDTYRNMQTLDGTNGYFTVTWQYEGGAKTVITNDVNGELLLPDGDGILHVPMAYPVPASDQNMFTTIKVKNADGRESEKSFYVFVKQPKNVTATIGTTVVGEGVNAPVTFTLNETSSSPSLYAYLEPLSEAASNLSYAAFFITNTVEVTARGAGGQGVPFGSGELVAVSDALIAGNGLKFFDNSNGHYVYNIRLSSSPTWDPSVRLSEFTENTLVIDVTNNVPVINLISGRNASNVDEDMSGIIPMSVGESPRVLRVTDVADVDADLKGLDDKQIVYRWAVYKLNTNTGAFPDVPTEVIYTIGLGSTISITNFFKTSQLAAKHCGLYKFSVRAQDKDMRAGQPAFFWLEGDEWKYSPEREVDGYARANARLYLERDPNSWGDPYEFQLRIDENPYVFLNPFGNRRSESQTGYAIFSEEDMVNEEEMGFVIALNAMPNTSGFDWIPFRVTITAEEGVNAAIAPVLSETQFDFDATFYSNRFTFLDFDGTWMSAAKTKGGLYRIVAEVSDPTAQAEDGSYWADLYRPYTNYFRIENFKPIVVGDPRGEYAEHNSATNAVLAGFHPAPGERFNFSWALEDVDSDMASNMVVTCVAGGQVVAVETNDTGSGVFSVWFDKQGSQKLQVYATDKDGDTGYSEWFYFEVQRSKNVRLYPFGPADSDVGGDEASKYSGQPGFGVGRVWADGVFNTIKAFMHEWTYGVEAGSANVFAEGYAAGQRDTSMAGDKSIAPKQNGSGVGEGDERYVNRSIYDSFFYRWFKYEPGQGNSTGNGAAGASSSGETEWTAGAPNPAKQRSTTLNLPMNLEGGTTYPDAAALAVFSREKYIADNMGDINGDGIPDAYAARVWTSDAGESKRLYEIAGGGAEGSGGSVGGFGGGEADSSINDLIDLSAYNDDFDFLPAAASAGNPLKPTVFDWGPGVKFDGLYEIRGIGMSEASEREPEHLGLNEPGVSDYDLSPAERYALFADYAAAGNALTGVLDDDYTAATNWATATQWTPEVRTNPVKADTDGDGMDDGWEYYFWYYAKVGAITNGVWGRLEGRRYDVAAPATGTRISPAEIVKHFNPLERNALGDFDSDGLSDLEEYALGTNPIDWDSDGDGMNDLWEVMNGLDPLNPSDGAGNPDADFMAKCTYDDDTFTVYTFANGEMYGLPTKSSPLFTADPIATSTNVYEVVVANGGDGEYYYAIAPAENDGSKLLADTECFETIAVDGVVYLQSMTTVTLPADTPIISAAAEDSVTRATLFSGYYGADKIINSDLKTVKIWFAEKPAVIHQLDTGLLQLAADTAGFTTYDHVTNTSANAKSVPYLGEATVFPAGTLLKAVAATKVHMTQVNTPPYIETPFGAIGGFTWRNPETLENEATGKALPLFNYGGDGTTYVPCSQKADHFAFAPVLEDKDRKLTRSAVVKAERKHRITLIHNQVYNQYGFDPRTAWNIDDYGYVDMRWRTEDSESAGSKADSGRATRTAAYTSRDEYLVMQYRQQMRSIGDDGLRSYTSSLLNDGNGYLLGKGAKDIPGSVGRFESDTTYPNFPVSYVSSEDFKFVYALREEMTPFENSTNRTIVAHWRWLQENSEIHGADTDYDGIPDGWELYVNADPNHHEDGTLKDRWADDGDELNMLKEYAGVDSCNAYTNRFNKAGREIYPEAYTITKNHPGKTSGWWNKFFPTDPHDKDTDGDGLLDDAEGKSWNGEFYVGNNWYGSTPMSFIYGTEENAEKYAADGSSICFRGGGLNPCTVDTDGDLLPDAWEFQFAGVVFKDGAPVSWAPRENDLKILTMADGKQAACPETGSVIRGGMDGTWNGDDSLDFDHDGLANCQEYLVQSLRHLRYDDPFTPLMGIHPGTKQFLKFIPFSAWDGESFHKRCLAAGFTGLGTWKYSELGYFTLPPHKWDPLYQNTTGQRKCKNYADSEGAGYRIMLPPLAIRETGETYALYVNGGMQYASTDPRRWDSDEDGMDDYYELFHGLNPLLGSAACPDGRDEYDWPNTRYDVIAKIHNSYVTSWRNYWTGWPIDRVQPAFDAIRFPWMMGTMECDADGDGLRNDEESIKVNLAKPGSTHTDPTPLWMTDSTSTKFASYTAQYYNPDPYITEVPDYDPLTTYPDIFGFPWDDLTWYIATRGLGMTGATSTWMFAFEENEGYDTDHDFKRDTVELSGLPTNGTFKVEMTSDPQMFTDPDRRQALYFPGLVGDIGSAAASRDGKFTRAVSEEPDLLKQFTVELWVKPEGVVTDAVILERVCNYGPSTYIYSNAVLRANFRIGVDEDGHAYGEFEGSTANSGRVRVTAPDPLVADKWIHLAFTYDGAEAKLFTNGDVAPTAVQPGAGLIPANGVSGIQQEYYASVIPYGYLTLPCMTVLGAKAQNGAALALDKTTTWDDFGAYFKGWIDEVRIWDGARNPTDIHADYRKRYSMDDIKKMRSNEEQSGIFDQWVAGARRSSTTGLMLPAELLQHYNFTTLPGGIEAKNVLTEPVEFQENVFDNVRKPNGKTLDSSLLAGWWSTTPVHSTVYWNYAIIPWIGNTVAHLPFMDGSSPDSQYWSKDLAGVVKPTETGLISYEYSNTANPYPYYFYRRDRFNRKELLSALDRLSSTDSTSSSSNSSASAEISADSLAAKWQFQLRSDFIGTSDLVPLGGAFAKRDTDFWDGQGAMDAWTETSKNGELADANGNGIPDWAEAIGYNTVEAYLRALAEGLLPDGTKDSAFADQKDLKFDGVKDWWQKMYGLTGSAQEDTDKDGLADFVEYLVSEVFDFGGAENISPLLAKSNGKEFDYFRKAGLLYLGELFSDHDFMEDHLEREWSEIGAQPVYYDAHLDSDEDGWSNWAEIRSKCDMGYTTEKVGVKTNTLYVTYVGYDNYVSKLEEIRADTGMYELLETDFTIQAWGTDIYEPILKERFTGDYGSGYIKYRRMTPVYATTYAYKGYPLPEVAMTVRYTGAKDLTGANLIVKAYTDPNLERSDAEFSVANGNNRSVNVITLNKKQVGVVGRLNGAVDGYLREGKNTFVVSAVASNATTSASTILGVARNVDVGWNKVEFEVELLDESPICPRPTLAYSIGGENSESSSSGNNGSAEISSGSSHVYVYRYAVDEYTPPSSLVNRLILDKDIGERTSLHEGDFLADGVYDIDWTYFQNEVVRNPTVYGEGFPVTSVTYRVYSQPVNISAEATSNVTPYVEFTREFGATRARAVPVASGDYATIFYGARPTFAWRMTGDRPDTYTAFAIQVKDADGTVVWNSGVQQAPSRNANGDYEWTAPLYVGDQTTSGKVFANLENYTWQVIMYNSKYQSTQNAYWSDPRMFRMNVYGADEPNSADRHRLNVAVKYFGPGTMNVSSVQTAGTIRVEAFTSPDFSGEPAGRAFVDSLALVTDAVDHTTANATIIGLAPGKYYVRAYLDTTGDFVRNDWESWGYACPRGDTATGAIYAPTSFEIGEGLETPMALVYIEDCDTDQDCLPDVWEYDTAGTSKADFLTKKGPMENDNNGYISVNPNLEGAIADLINGGNSISLMSAGRARMPKTLAALMLGADSVDPSIDAKTLTIKSLALVDGNVTIALAAEAEDPAAGTVFVTDGIVKVTVVVKYADSLAGEWKSVERNLEKKIEDGAVSEELTFSLEELGLDASKGFFKVEVK